MQIKFFKVPALLAASVLTLSLPACGNKSDEKASTDTEELSGFSASADDDDDDLSSMSSSYEASYSSGDSSSSSSSNNWDDVLSSYEEYVDDYIQLVKKVNDGDMSAMSDLSGMMGKANEWGEKLASAQGEMTSSQWSKYMKIHEKLLKAAQDIKK